MGYQLAENQGTVLPYRSWYLRVCLSWKRMAACGAVCDFNRESDPGLIARALHLKSAASVRAALTYWKGAGF